MNDRDNFLKQIEQHQAVIHRLCRIYRDRAEDRDDLFQEIVVQLWKSWPQFRGDSSVLTWLYRIAVSTSIAKFRSPRHRFWKRIRSIDANPHNDQIQAAAAEENVSEAEHREALLAAIKTLSPVEKGIVALYLDDVKYDQIAEILGITANAARVKMHRIRNKLRQITERNSS